MRPLRSDSDTRWSSIRARSVPPAPARLTADRMDCSCPAALIRTPLKLSPPSNAAFWSASAPSGMSRLCESRLTLPFATVQPLKMGRALESASSAIAGVIFASVRIAVFGGSVNSGVGFDASTFMGSFSAPPLTVAVTFTSATLSLTCTGTSRRPSRGPCT